MVTQKNKWSYRIRKYSNGYGPYGCEIYYSSKKMDRHGLCETRKEAEDLAEFWVDWLKKCDKVFPYNPKKFPNWVDWYTRVYGFSMYPSLYYFDKEKETSIRILQK